MVGVCYRQSVAAEILLGELFWVGRRDIEEVQLLKNEETKEEWIEGVKLKRTVMASHYKTFKA